MPERSYRALLWSLALVGLLADQASKYGLFAWLQGIAGRGRRDAGKIRGAVHRLRGFSAVSSAWRDGSISSGHVEAIVANLDRQTKGVFAEHEAELLPKLADLSVMDCERAMVEWKARAKNLVEPDVDGDEPDRSLHLSASLGGRYLGDAAGRTRAICDLWETNLQGMR